MAELLEKFEKKIEEITLIPSDGGRYEVFVDGTLVFSKIKTRRHAEPGEVMQLVGKYLEDAK